MCTLPVHLRECKLLKATRMTASPLSATCRSVPRIVSIRIWTPQGKLACRVGKRTNHGREDWGALCCTRRCVAADSARLSAGSGCVRFFDRLPEPQADATTDVKLVPWCLRCCNPTYNVVTGESKNAPQSPHTYCSWTLSVGTRWGLRGAWSGPSPSLQKRAQGETEGLAAKSTRTGGLVSCPFLVLLQSHYSSLSLSWIAFHFTCSYLAISFICSWVCLFFAPNHEFGVYARHPVEK